jgi:hypothetical protein
VSPHCTTKIHRKPRTVRRPGLFYNLSRISSIPDLDRETQTWTTMKTIREVRYHRGQRGARVVNVFYDDDTYESGLEWAVLPRLQSWLSAGNSILPEPPKGYPNHLDRLAYQDNPALKQPTGETKVWRYMGFDQFVYMLANQKLWFSRVTSFRENDPYEGWLPKSTLSKTTAQRAYEMHRIVLSAEEVTQFEISHEYFRQLSLLNLACCFNQAKHESNAMWNVYGKGPNCIAITSTLEHLKRAFKAYVDYDVYIGEVQYIDYAADDDEVDERNYLLPLVHKAPFYEYEQEIRCLILDDGDIGLFSHDEPSPFEIAEAMRAGSTIKFSPGAEVPVDLKELIQSVVIGPFAAPWFKPMVEKVLEKFDVKADVFQSALRIT